MTNKIAFTLAVLIAALFLVDHFLLHLGLPLMLARGMDGFIEYIIFWR